MASPFINNKSDGGNMFNLLGDMKELDRRYGDLGRRVQFELPTVHEGSQDSLTGGAPLVPISKDNPIAATRSTQSKSVNTSPESDNNGFDVKKPSPQLSEPTELQTKTQRNELDMGVLIEKFAQAELESPTTKLNPTTAEFKPTTPTLAQTVFDYNAQGFDGQNDGVPVSTNSASGGMNPLQPQNGSVTNPLAQGAPAGLKIFNHNNEGSANLSADSTSTGLNTFASQNDGITNMSGIPRIQPAMTMQPNNNANSMNGTNGMAFACPTRDSSQMSVNGVYRANGLTFGAANGNSIQQPLNSINCMPMATAPILNGTNNSMYRAIGQNYIAPGVNGTNSSAQDQMSMNALQAHLNGLNQYPQAQTNMMSTFPQGPAQPSQTMHQPVIIQSPNGITMLQQQQQQQHGQITPMQNRTGVMSPTDRCTPSSYMFSPHSSSASNFGSPVDSAMGGRPGHTEPRNFAPRTNGSVTNEPPPRFVLQTPAPAQHQGYSDMTSPSRSGDDSFSPGGPAVDPFNGPALSSVIRPIEPPSNALVLHNNPIPDHIKNLRSKQLNELTAGRARLPSAAVALSSENFPFIEGARNAQPTASHGVVKLKNIPFSTQRSEILAFLGRNSKVLNDNQEPVHIIMERVTSKTNDAYVEFMSMQAAVNAVEKHQRTVASGRLNRLGDRPVEVELSSQAQLMQDLFPLAKGIRWDGPHPVILEDHPTEPWSCFKGFVSEEEMTMLVRHVLDPRRSPFSRDCPQRPFECMISTLRKLPWYMTDRITIKQRWSVYNACINLLRLLQYAIKEKKNEACLSSQLFKRLWTSAMLCHGFTVTMKDNIAFEVDLSEDQMRGFNMPRFANMWVHSYTLTPKPGTPLDVLEWYIAIIREETHRTLGLELPNVQAEIHKEGAQTNLYFGYYFKELRLPHGPVFDNMTLAQMAGVEFNAIGNVIQRALSQ